MPRYFKVVNDETGEVTWCVEKHPNPVDKIVLVPIKDEELLKKLNKPREDK
jgi:hypothetical protein